MSGTRRRKKSRPLGPCCNDQHELVHGNVSFKNVQQSDLQRRCHSAQGKRNEMEETEKALRGAKKPFLITFLSDASSPPSSHECSNYPTPVRAAPQYKTKQGPDALPRHLLNKLTLDVGVCMDRRMPARPLQKRPKAQRINFASMPHQLGKKSERASMFRVSPYLQMCKWLFIPARTFIAFTRCKDRIRKMYPHDHR